MSDTTEDREDSIPEPEKHLHVLNAADARAQASEAMSFLASEFRQVKPTRKGAVGEIFEIPHKDLFDPDQQDRWDELLHTVRGYDRGPDLTQIAAEDGTVIRPAQRGEVLIPHSKDGELVRPSWSERLGIVLWGEEAAKRFRDGGGNFNEIEIVWARQAENLRKWREADSKSAGSYSGLAAVPDSD